MAPTISASGACLCGAVRYAVHGVLRPVVFCHCDQCRASSGNFVAATACAPDDLVLESSERLCWYASSEAAERGFCGQCGSNLFWRPRDGGHVSIMAGTIRNPTGLQASAHIYVASAADYLTIADGLPQHDRQAPDVVTALDE